MAFNTPARRKPSFRLALLAAVLTLAVIMLGAFTRLSHAGLGCPDWPTCYGHVLWPTTATEIEHANAAFRDFNANLDTTVDTSKTWPEQVHRIFASSLGTLAIVLLGLAIHHRARPGQPLKLPLFVVAFIILQGIFGWLTVKWLVWPQVVTAHLLGGFTMLCLFWLLVLRLNNRRWCLPEDAVQRLQGLRPWAVGALCVVVLQVALGGWTTSNYAAVACPDLPTCQGEWVPPMDFRQGFDVFQHIGPNYLGGRMDNAARVAIHMAHRIGAMITFLYVLGLVAVLWRTGMPETRRMGTILGGMLLLQVSLGLGNVLFHFPLAVAVAHNAGGALLLATVVTLLHRLYTVEPRQGDQDHG